MNCDHFKVIRLAENKQHVSQILNFEDLSRKCEEEETSVLVATVTEMCAEGDSHAVMLSCHSKVHVGGRKQLTAFQFAVSLGGCSTLRSSS